MNDGGPAFPVSVVDVYDSSGIKVREGGVITGMTLRDWFAGMAMQGMLASDRQENGGFESLGGLDQSAYFNADAMLAERSKTK